MWYRNDPSGLKWDQLLALYKIIDQRERAFREDLFRFTNFYAAVCYAILAVTLSGFMSFYGKGPIILGLLFGPILTLAMCTLGFRVTSKIYRRIIEEVSIKAKLENLMGMDKPLSVADPCSKENVWAEDDCILPPRHAKRRLREKCSADFIKTAACSGFYRDNAIYFGLIAVFSIVLTGVIITIGIIGR